MKPPVVLIASAAIVATVVAFVGLRATVTAVRQAGVLAFAAVGVDLAVLLALQAAALWALSQAVGHRVPFAVLLKAATAGMAANVLAPSTYLAGEPVKVVYIGRRTGLPYPELAGTVVLAKYLTALSFLLVFGAGTVAAVVSFRDRLFRPPYVSGGVAMLVLAAALVALCGVLWLALSRGWRPLTALVGLAARLRVGRQFLARLRQRTRQMEDQVARVFCEERRAAVGAFGLIVLSHGVIVVKPALFFFLGWRMPLGLGELGLLFVAGQALLAFQVTPSGAGTLEAVMLGAFAVLGAGVTHAQCLAYVLCIHFWDAVVVAVGAVLAGRVGAGLLGAQPAASAAGHVAEDGG